MKQKINNIMNLMDSIEYGFKDENGNIKVIFKYEDKYFEDLDFINKQKYDI